MADTKHDYRVKVFFQKVKGFFSKRLDLLFERAQKESFLYKKNWQKVNINAFVKKFASGAKGEISEDGRKIFYQSKHNNLRVVADVAGGYCRLEDTTKRGKERYLDINGNDARNYINSRGKKQGRNNVQFNAATHFKILKRKEM